MESSEKDWHNPDLLSMQPEITKSRGIKTVIFDEPFMLLVHADKANNCLYFR